MKMLHESFVALSVIWFLGQAHVLLTNVFSVTWDVDFDDCIHFLFDPKEVKLRSVKIKIQNVLEVAFLFCPVMSWNSKNVICFQLR